MSHRGDMQEKAPHGEGDRGRDCSNSTASQAMPRSVDSRRSRERSMEHRPLPPQALLQEPAPAAPAVQASGLQDGEKINLCCF